MAEELERAREGAAGAADGSLWRAGAAWWVEGCWDTEPVSACIDCVAGKYATAGTNTGCIDVCLIHISEPASPLYSA